MHAAGVRLSVPADSWSTGGATLVDVGPSVRVHPHRLRRPPVAVDAALKCRRQLPPERQSKTAENVSPPQGLVEAVERRVAYRN